MAPVPAGHPEKPTGEDGRKMLLRMNGGDHESLANWGLDFLGLSGDEKRLLDVGCGGGANLQRLMERCPHAHATGIDHSRVSVALSDEVNAAAIAEGRCQVLEGNVLDLPFDEDYFDVITAFETIYFWPNVTQAIAELHRVLKPGGRLLVCNDSDGTSTESQKTARQIEGMSLYTAYQLVTLMERVGFIHIETNTDDLRRVCAIGTK